MSPAVYQWAARHGVSLQAVHELAKYGIDGSVNAGAYFAQNIKIGLIFMAVAIVRSYVIRRWFNARIHAAAMRLAGGK